jgi:hypothetical protein
MCGLIRLMSKEATSDHPLEQTLSRSVDHGLFFFFLGDHSLCSMEGTFFYFFFSYVLFRSPSCLL